MPTAQRSLVSTPVVSRFRGLNRFSNIADVPPDSALDCLNVMCSLSGGLFPLRKPISITPTVDTTTYLTGTCYGLYDYQRPDGVRQIVSVWDTKIYVMTYVGAKWEKPVLMSTDADNAYFWSMVSSNNFLFMANGKRMLKWDGQSLQKWGIKRPTNTPTVDAVNDGAGSVNLLTGRKYRAAYKNSVTDTVSSASDPSDSSGPASNATIDVSIDAQADAAADPQIDTVVWYATQDDGVEYFYHSEVAVNLTGLTQLVDNDYDPAFASTVEQPTITDGKTELCDPTLQDSGAPAYWQYIVPDGFPQWRTIGPNPPAGIDLPEMRTHDWNYSIPENAKITGVAVKFDAANQNPTTNYIKQVRLFKAGAAAGTAKNFGNTDHILQTADTAYTFGANLDMWGLDDTTLTPADVNDPGFGFGVTIRYTENGSGQRAFFFIFKLVVYYIIPVTINPGDDTLETNRNAPLINDPPPLGKYLSLWGGRIFIAGLVDAPQEVAYSGYEAILDGRPEEAFPPGNRLLLAVGADWIRGMGVVQAGLIIGSKSNEMFMFRGEVEDVVTGTPLSFTEVLETLPFGAAFASHYSNVSTKAGLIYFSAQRSVDIYSGVKQPDTISLPAIDLLRDIPALLEEKCQGAFYNYLERDWYVFVFPYGNGATKANRVIIIDLDMNADSNSGIFVFSVGDIDAMNIVEDPASGRPMIVIAQAGELREIKAITTGKGGLTDTDTADMVPLTRPYWKSGWWGGDTPSVTRMWRHAYLVSDGGDGDPVSITYNPFRLLYRLVDDRTHTFRSPEASAAYLLPTTKYGKMTINRKSKRCSIEIQFPIGVAASVQQLWTSSNPTSER